MAAWRDGLPAPCRLLLAPAAGVYRAGLLLREAAYVAGIRRTRRLPCRVVSVGNLTVGGTGKTPLVELIARELLARDHRVVVLSRGYGRRGGADIEWVSDGTRLLSSVERAGDEPVLLARRLTGVPIVVGRDRLRTGAAALDRFSPDVLLLDDGFQQRRIAKDVEVVCLDARAPWGPGGLLPRGSLREPRRALRRAHLLVLTQVDGLDLGPVVADVRGWAPHAPLVPATYEVEETEDVGSGSRQPLEALRGRAVLAFAGIGSPSGFARTLEAHGVVPRALVPFPDHHPYGAADLTELERRAEAVGADVLVTTEKDAVRLPPRLFRPVWSVRVRLRLGAGETSWRARLDERLTGPRCAGDDR